MSSEVDGQDELGSTKLHLACGRNLIPGWLNTDLVPLEGTTPLDFTKPFPYPDASFDAVFCEHAIEHVSKEEGAAMCAEVFRVLRNGGRFRVVTPAIESIAAMALSEGSFDTRFYLAWYRGWNKAPNATLSDAINAMFYMHGHRHLYMRGELSDLLKSCGFSGIQFFGAGEYGDRVFDGVDGHGKVIGKKINAMESVAVEATKV
jgi:SAM-dependent methyltransferase